MTKRTRVTIRDRHERYVEANWFSLSGFLQEMLDLLVVPPEEIPEDERPDVPLVPTPLSRAVHLTETPAANDDVAEVVRRRYPSADARAASLALLAEQQGEEFNAGVSAELAGETPTDESLPDGAVPAFVMPISEANGSASPSPHTKHPSGANLDGDSDVHATDTSEARNE